MTLIQKLIAKLKRLFFEEQDYMEDDINKHLFTKEEYEEKLKREQQEMQDFHNSKSREDALKFADEINNDHWLTGESG